MAHLCGKRLAVVPATAEDEVALAINAVPHGDMAKHLNRPLQPTPDLRHLNRVHLHRCVALSIYRLRVIRVPHGRYVSCDSISQ